MNVQPIPHLTLFESFDIWIAVFSSVGLGVLFVPGAFFVAGAFWSFVTLTVVYVASMASFACFQAVQGKLFLIYEGIAAGVIHLSTGKDKIEINEETGLCKTTISDCLTPSPQSLAAFVVGKKDYHTPRHHTPRHQHHHHHGAGGGKAGGMPSCGWASVPIVVSFFTGRIGILVYDAVLFSFNSVALICKIAPIATMLLIWNNEYGLPYLSSMDLDVVLNREAISIFLFLIGTMLIYLPPQLYDKLGFFCKVVVLLGYASLIIIAAGIAFVYPVDTSTFGAPSIKPPVYTSAQKVGALMYVFPPSLLFHDQTPRFIKTYGIDIGCNKMRVVMRITTVFTFLFGYLFMCAVPFEFHTVNIVVESFMSNLKWYPAQFDLLVKIAFLLPFAHFIGECVPLSDDLATIILRHTRDERPGHVNIPLSRRALASICLFLLGHIAVEPSVFVWVLFNSASLLHLFWFVIFFVVRRKATKLRLSAVRRKIMVRPVHSTNLGVPLSPSGSPHGSAERLDAADQSVSPVTSPNTTSAGKNFTLSPAKMTPRKLRQQRMRTPNSTPSPQGTQTPLPPPSMGCTPPSTTTPFGLSPPLPLMGASAPLMGSSPPPALASSAPTTQGGRNLNTTLMDSNEDLNAVEEKNYTAAGNHNNTNGSNNSNNNNGVSAHHHHQSEEGWFLSPLGMVYQSSSPMAWLRSDLWLALSAVLWLMAALYFITFDL